MRIAILEDDPDQLALVDRWLKAAGHGPHGFLQGRDLVRQAGRESYDLFILDWQVPDLSGIEVLEWLRAHVTEPVPVLFTTVRDAEEDIVHALNTGADDYMIKPIRQHELLARVGALLRRAYPNAQSRLVQLPPYEIDLVSHEWRKGDRRIELTPKEFDLGAFLARNVGRLLSRGHLLREVWGWDTDLYTRTVDTHVSQLRRKVFTPESGFRLSPVYNYGYRLEAEVGAK